MRKDKTRSESASASPVMEAQALLLRFSSNPTKMLRRILQPQSSLSIQSQLLLSRKTHFESRLVSQRELPSRPYLCRNGVGNDFSLDQEDFSGIRPPPKNLAVFVSGGGSNFRSIHEAVAEGRINGQVVLLVTDKPDCGGAAYARDKSIPVIFFPQSRSLAEGLSPADLITALRSFNVDFLLLAGYLKLIPVELIRAYPRSVLNIHPSLLPSFGGKGYYGLKVHKAVIASGARYSGPTVHFVDEHYDTGRILAQSVVPVLVSDTAEELASRVLHEEHRLYVEVTKALCEERIVWREDGVPLIRSRENPNEYS